jgi:hypothetical protein
MEGKRTGLKYPVLLGEGNRAGTVDAEVKGNRVDSTGAVAHGAAPGIEARPDVSDSSPDSHLTNAHDVSCESAHQIGHGHARDRRARIGRGTRAPASPKSSATRVIRAAMSRKIMSIVLSSRNHPLFYS